MGAKGLRIRSISRRQEEGDGGKEQRAGDPPARKTTAWQAEGRERGGKVISDK